MIKDFCNAKITIYKQSHDINDEGEWVEHMIKWKEIWADITQTFIKGHVPYYRFAVRWNDEFPLENLIVRLGNAFFKLTTPPFRSLDKTKIIFSAIPISKASMKGYINASI